MTLFTITAILPLSNVGSLPYIVVKSEITISATLTFIASSIKTPLIKLEKDEKVDDFSQYMNEPEETKETEYTKTEINRMSTSDLKELAEKNGLDNSLSGAELKKLLINHYGL